MSECGIRPCGLLDGLLLWKESSRRPRSIGRVYGGAGTYQGAPLPALIPPKTKLRHHLPPATIGFGVHRVKQLSHRHRRRRSSTSERPASSFAVVVSSFFRPSSYARQTEKKKKPMMIAAISCRLPPAPPPVGRRLQTTANRPTTIDAQKKKWCARITTNPSVPY